MFAVKNRACLVIIILFQLCSGNTCDKGDCVAIPLISRLTAPLTVQLDISDLNEQLKELIKLSVKQEIKDAITTLVHNTIDEKLRSTKEKLIGEINKTMDFNARHLNVQAFDSKFKKQNQEIDELKGQLATTNAVVLENSRKVSEIQTMIHTMDIQMKAANQTFDSRSRLFDMKFRELEDRQNRTNQDILTYQVADRKQVAISACIQSGLTSSLGGVIKFTDVKMSSGVSKLSHYISTGKFTCEYPGLYHITVTMTAGATAGVYVQLMKNNAEYIELYDESSKGVHTSTSATTLTLDTNDTLYIKSSAITPLYGRNWSCMSITKIV